MNFFIYIFLFQKTDRERQKSFQVAATITLRRTKSILTENMLRRRKLYARELQLGIEETILTRFR